MTPLPFHNPDRRFQAAGLVFLVVQALYVATACRTVGPGDSGELTAVMTTWGVAHAPGYPLLSLIGNIVSAVPFPGEPAFLLNLLSGFFGALAAGVLVLAVTALTGSAPAGIVAGLALGTSRVYWEYALVVEVFSLNSLGATLLFFLLARFMEGLNDRKPVTWPLPAAAVVLSTAITHHLTLALVGIPVLVTFAALLPGAPKRGLSHRRIGNAIALSIACGLTGLLPLVYLPLAARANPFLNWGNPVDLPGLLHLLKREDFGSGTLMSPWAVATTVLENGLDTSPIGRSHYLRYLSEIPRNFGWVLPLLAITGLVRAALRARFVLLLAGVAAVFFAIFFARVNSPILPLYLGVTERFYILPNTLVALLAGLGAAWLLETLRRAGRAAMAAAAILLTAGTAGVALVVNYAHVDQRTNTFTRDFGANFLAGIPENAVVLSEGDLYHNAFAYQQACLGRRPDLLFVDLQKLSYPWYVNVLKRAGAFRLPGEMTAYSNDPATQSKAWLDLNLKPDGSGRPVVAVTFQDATWNVDYRIAPRGFWWRVYPKAQVPPLADQAREFAAIGRDWTLDAAHRHYPERSWEAGERAVYTRALSFLGGTIDIAGDLANGTVSLDPGPEAGTWFNQALSISGANAAAVTGVRVEHLHRVIADGLVDYGAFDGPAPLIRKLVALARAAVAADSTNAEALTSLAALVRSDPDTYSFAEEIRVRRKLLDEKPAREADLGAYVQIAIDRANDPAVRDRDLLRDAIARQRTMIRMLDEAIAISSAPQFVQRRDQWRNHLGRSEQLLRSMGPG